MSRKITVVLEIQDQESANAIWDAHSTDNSLSGCRVIHIVEGDRVAPYEAWSEPDTKLFDCLGDDIEVL